MFSSKGQTLLVWWDTLFVLILSFLAFIECWCDGFTSQCCHKYLHSTTKSRHQMKIGFFMDLLTKSSNLPIVFQEISNVADTCRAWLSVI